MVSVGALKSLLLPCRFGFFFQSKVGAMEEGDILTMLEGTFVHANIQSIHEVCLNYLSIELFTIAMKPRFDCSTLLFVLFIFMIFLHCEC